MNDIISFFEWFMENLPYFLISDPIKYFTGFFILGIAGQFIISIVRGFNK